MIQFLHRPACKTTLITLLIVLLLPLTLVSACKQDGPKKARGADPSPPAIAGPPTEGNIAGEQRPWVRAVPKSDKLVRQGIEVAFSVAPVHSREGRADVLEGDSTEISFVLTDTTTGGPVAAGSQPGVWIDLQKAAQDGEERETLSCQNKVRLYAQGSLGFRPDIDLNSYFVLALNIDSTISVIDPLLGVGGMTQLYTLIALAGRGEDWALSDAEGKLFVAMPQVGQVAVIDTESFKVLKNIGVGNSPSRLALQPDGKRLWVSIDAGVAVIDTATLEVIAQIRTGAGPHEFAFSGGVTVLHQHEADDHATGRHEEVLSGDTQYVWITNGRAGTLSIVDAEWLVKEKDIKVGGTPASLDYSTVSKSIYVGDHDNGVITVVDGTLKEVVERLEVARGTSDLRFAPGDRWGFAISAPSNTVQVIDASSNRVVHKAEVAGEPDEVSFTHGYAYVRSTKTADVALVDLFQLDQAGPLAILQIIGGQKPPAESRFHSIADAVFPIHEHGNHVLIANPADSYIYYYMEGMKAPMGGFQNYGRVPTAARVVDRGLRPTAPGAYSARVRLPRGGQYQVAFFLDSPRIVDCFTFTAKPGSSLENQDTGQSLRIRTLNGDKGSKPGERFTLRFALFDSRKNEPVSGLNDVQIVATLASGLWSERYRAVSAGDGVYEATLTLPRPGAYSALVSIPSLKVGFNQLPPLTLNVVAPETRSQRNANP